MLCVPESLFDQPSDERQMRDIVSCGDCSRSQSPHDFHEDLLLCLRVPR